ncbi:hypothetical protein [Novosphingobium rosa]|uniref:hypothetical protein n=1 Tax=Novosphingobium rosa TaxID=76978 RepID=UPI00082A9F12|nr:hypothetical protein [Novosphingobium rosa]
MAIANAAFSRATTALPFDAVRVIYALGNTTSLSAVTPTLYASVAAVSDTSDASLTAASWTGVTFGGANAIGGASFTTLPPPPAAYDRRAFLLSDIIPLSSLPRSDGGVFPLLVTRVWLIQNSGASAPIVISGNGAQSFANWASHPSGRIWRMLNKGGGWANNGQSGMSSVNSSVGTGSPIAGVVYYARGKVVNVVGVGDSITEGQGTYVGEGFGFPACNALSAASAGVAYEWSDLGWAGCTTAQMRQNLIDGLAMGLRWDVGVLPGGSPNDATGADHGQHRGAGAFPHRSYARSDAAGGNRPGAVDLAALQHRRQGLWRQRQAEARPQ